MKEGGEGGRGGGGERERDGGKNEMGERKKHLFVVPFLDAVIGCFLCVPSLGSKPAALVYWQDTNQLSYGAGAPPVILK